jgi:tetratricopeptide (TPR) repeat protein
MIKQIQIFLGPARVRAFILLLGLTGLISLVLNAVGTQDETVRAVQTLMVVIFLVGTAIIFGGRLRQEERLRWVAILAPSIGALLLGVTVLPHLMLPLLGAAVGWIVAGAFLFRRRIPKEYQDAIKFLRKGQYEESVKAMDALIKDEPDNENYYRFRAEVFRMWGKLDRAKKDYTKMIEVAPESAVAYNGLAEVYLQSGQYAEAQRAGLRAYELAPEEWVAAYNLGMIDDRLKMPDAAVEHLNQALALKVPDGRHRLLIHLYLARAYARKGDLDAAQRETNQMKRHKNGLEEWQNLLEHPEAATLRAVLEVDIQTAQDLIDGKVDLKAIAR